MDTWQIILAIVIIGLSIIMPIYYSSEKKKNEQQREIEKIKVDEVPENIIEEEVKILSQGMSEEEAKKNRKSFEEKAKTRIKTGLILNEFGEQNQIKVTEQELQSEVQKQIRNIFNEPIKKSRKVTAGPGSTHMPDFVKMTSVGKSGRAQDSLRKPFDNDWIKNPFGESILPRTAEMEDFIDDKINQRSRMTKDVQRAIDNYQSALGITRTSILKEAGDNELSTEETFEVDLDNLEGTITDE